jgi:hypothetical protein
MPFSRIGVYIGLGGLRFPNFSANSYNVAIGIGQIGLSSPNPETTILPKMT